jgi:hypothetical protein
VIDMAPLATLLIVAAGALLVAAVLGWIVHANRAGRSVGRPRRWWRGRARDDGDLGHVERLLTSRVLAGNVDPAEYRSRLAALAEEDYARRIEIRCALTLDHRARALLEPLRVALPEVPPATLSAAINLAGYGASVEDLVRLLGLTRAQAFRITVVTPGAGDHRD